MKSLTFFSMPWAYQEGRDNDFNEFISHDFEALGPILDEVRDDLESFSVALDNATESPKIGTDPEIKEESKSQSTFSDPRLWEYFAQIKIDGHEPADILEAWLKEHNPEYFEDSD